MKTYQHSDLVTFAPVINKNVFLYIYYHDNLQGVYMYSYGAIKVK